MYEYGRSRGFTIAFLSATLFLCVGHRRLLAFSGSGVTLELMSPFPHLTVGTASATYVTGDTMKVSTRSRATEAFRKLVGISALKPKKYACILEAMEWKVGNRRAAFGRDGTRTSRIAPVNF